MAELDVTVTSVNRMVWHGKAKAVVLKTVLGDMGILVGHEPVLAVLADGPLRIDTLPEEGGESEGLWFAVHGGFFSLDSNVMHILVEYTEMASEIDLERAKAAKERAEAAGADDEDEVEALRRAETRIDVAMAASGKR